MLKPQRKRLQVNKQVLRQLCARDLREAVAGMDGSGRDPSCDICGPTMPHGGCM
jgi:hypothetical protein